MATENAARDTLHAFNTAWLMFLDHQDHSAPFIPGAWMPMRLESGLPFGLYDIPWDNPQEGRTIAAVAGEFKDLADLERYPEGPLIRMHSACVFSEIGNTEDLDKALNRQDITNTDLAALVLSIARRTQPSLECDCRAQREASQALMAQQGGIYFDLMEQEGRGAGLAIKRQTYELHAQEGLDTAEAYDRLGVPWDTRRYDHIARALLSMGIHKVRLLSNNPRKIAALEAHGIQVIPVELVVGVTETNLRYLQTKRDKAGHDFPSDDMLESLIK